MKIFHDKTGLKVFFLEKCPALLNRLQDTFIHYACYNFEIIHESQNIQLVIPQKAIMSWLGTLHSVNTILLVTLQHQT